MSDLMERRELPHVAAIEFAWHGDLKSSAIPYVELLREIAEWVEENPGAAILHVDFDNTNQPQGKGDTAAERLVDILFGDNDWPVYAILYYEPVTGPSGPSEQS